MNSKIVFLVVAVCFAQLANGRQVPRAAQAPSPAPDTESPWETALKLANQTLTQFHDSFLKIVGVSSDNELWEKAKTQFTTLENTVRSSVADLNEQSKPLQAKAQDLVKEFTNQVTKVTDELKAKNPELFSGDAEKLRAVGERSLRTIVDETAKLRTRLQEAGAEITPKIEATLKQVVDSAQETAQQFKTQAEAAVNTIAKQN